MGWFHRVDGGLEWRSAEQFVRVEAWGEDSVRVRSGVGRLIEDAPGALLAPDPAHAVPAAVTIPDPAEITRSAESELGAALGVSGPPAVLAHGRLRVEISPAGALRFLDVGNADDVDGAELLAEQPEHPLVRVGAEALGQPEAAVAQRVEVARARPPEVFRLLG